MIKTTRLLGVLPPNQYDWIKGLDFLVGIGLFLDEHQMSRETHYLLVFGKMASGVNREQAQGEMDAISGRLAAQYPASSAHYL